MKNFRENKGITLIALIITIVVLLIIAGISISGGIEGIDKADDNRAMSDLEKVQHAITERYTKFELLKDKSLIVGTKVDTLPTLPTPTGDAETPTWKVFQGGTDENLTPLPEREYYRLSKSDLENLGLTGDYKNSSYIVNYYSGEVFDETVQTTSKGIVLYKTAIENEASAFGDDYVKSGMLAWYDAINNTGSGHSDSATTWKDLSGNGNDAKITTTGSSLNWKNDCLATNKAETIITPWTFSTSYTVSVVFSTLEFYNYNTIWESSSNPDYNEAWVYANGTLGARSSNTGGYITYNTSFRNRYKKITKFDVLIDNENNICNSYINGKSEEAGGTVKLDNGKLVFNGGIRNALGKNNYYSMKVYNKALSADEIKHNYILDKNRYGIEE